MKLLKLLLLSIFVITLSCSSSNDEPDSSGIETPNTDGETGGEGEQEEEEEENNEQGQVITVDGIKIGPNYVVFEPEVTKSDLGLWVKRIPSDSKYHVVSEDEIDAINKGYLEFTGNDKNSGPATSPLKYTFKCPKSAKYRIVMRMLQPLKDGEEGDKRNDVYIKLAGNFTSACKYPVERLKKNTKFWGRGVRKWGSIFKLEAHVDEKVVKDKVVYNLTKDEEYTLTISGRAQGCSIDYILFYEESLSETENFNIAQHVDLAADLPEYLKPDVIE